MNIKLIGAPRIIMSNPCGKENYFAWPCAARLQNGKIAVVSSGYRYEHICPFGKGVIAYSENEGETYTIPAPLFNTPLDDRDSGILAFGESGVIVTSFNNSREFQRNINEMRKSGKRSWERLSAEFVDAYLDTVTDEEEEKYLGSVFRISNDCGVTFGPIYKSPVTSPHGPTELSDGTVLWVGTQHSRCDYGDDKYYEIQAYKINTDDGSTEYIGTVPPITVGGKRRQSCEPYTVELDDGTLLCHIRISVDGDEKMFTLFQTVSKDKGATWSEPKQILSNCGGAPSHIFKHSSGMLIAAYGYREKPYGIRLMFSCDNGESWETDIPLYTSGANEDVGYPCSIELAEGSLLTVFYAHEKTDEPTVIMQQIWRMEE